LPALSIIFQSLHLAVPVTLTAFGCNAISSFKGTGWALRQLL